MESGSYGGGGRVLYDGLITPDYWQGAVDEALRLARSVENRTWPNPPVGAVIVKDGGIVGSGAHHGPGTSHAEPVALAAAGSAADENRKMLGAFGWNLRVLSGLSLMLAPGETVALVGASAEHDHCVKVRLTDLEVRVPLNMNVLDADHTPRVMPLAEVLRAFLDHRHEVLLRRLEQRVERFRA